MHMNDKKEAWLTRSSDVTARFRSFANSVGDSSSISGADEFIRRLHWSLATHRLSIVKAVGADTALAAPRIE
jgi:hypothetical protein